MSEKTESEVLSLAESNDSDSEEDHLDQYFSLGSKLRLRLVVFKNRLRLRLGVFRA